MTETARHGRAEGQVLIEDRFDRRLALAATGVLARFNAADVLAAADVHVADRLADIVGETSPAVRLAAALCVRAVRLGSVCVDLATISELPLEEDVELPWPETHAWLAEVEASPLVSETLLRLEGTLLYLDRYWREEGQVCADLLERLARRPPELDEPVLERGLLRVFPGEGYDEQRAAARRAAGQWTTVLTGGPGTGKTTTVAGVLALVAEQHERETGEPPRIALAAPTGKAAARLQAAVREAVSRFGEEDARRIGDVRAVTVHSLLGSRMPRTSVRFKHHRSNRLPHDIVVVDEASMLALSMAARVLEAVRPTTRLVLVGDPGQLASVDAGAVLADVVEGLSERADSPVIRLESTHRYGEEIEALAQALRDADPDRVVGLLREAGQGLSWIDPEDQDAMARLRADVHTRASRLLSLARRGDRDAALAELDEHRLLCAHREGRFGVAGWNREVERLLAEDGETHVYNEWYAGRPVLVSANDRALGLYNGDMGVTVLDHDDGNGRSRLRVLVPGADESLRANVLRLPSRGHPEELRTFATTRMPEVSTAYAMTVHKSQGSEARRVTVVLPPEDSRLLTRELFYTAVTRARERVTVVGSEAAVRAAVERQVQRASGLRQRLAEHSRPTDTT